MSSRSREQNLWASCIWPCMNKEPDLDWNRFLTLLRDCHNMRIWPRVCDCDVLGLYQSAGCSVGCLTLPWPMLRRIRAGYGQELLGQKLVCSNTVQFCCLWQLSLMSLLFNFFLVLGKADLRNDLSMMDKVLVFFSVLCCYIDGGALKVVGEHNGQPSGGWGGKQDDIRFKRSVCALSYC